MPALSALDRPWRVSSTYRSATGNAPAWRSTTCLVLSRELLSTTIASQVRRGDRSRAIDCSVSSSSAARL
jgi:hypothetical protein